MQHSKSFAQTGGARVGSSFWLALNVTVPLAKIRVTASEITIVIGVLRLKREYRFPKNSIERLSIYHGVFSRGVRIEHRCAELPRFVLFWTTDAAELATALAHYGYPYVPEQQTTAAASNPGTGP